MSNKHDEILSIIENSKNLIDKNIYKFLFNLLYSIFFKKDETRKTKNEIEALDEVIKKINIIIVKIYGEANYINKKISRDFTKDNFINILNFVKTQNKIYAGEIIENILIVIFSFIFKTRRENTFGKFLYNNLSKILQLKIDEFASWFKSDKLIGRLKKLNEILENDISPKTNSKNQIQENPFYNLLAEIYDEKYNKKFITKVKLQNYLNRGKIDYLNKTNQKSFLNDESRTEYDKFVTLTDFSEIGSNCLYDFEIGRVRRLPISLIRPFFISVYIYYQNKNSPLMKYIKKPENENDIKLNLQNIPFVYNLSEAIIESQYAGIILSPLRIEKRVEEIKMYKNILKEPGLLELTKVFLFNNKNIKDIDIHTNLIKSYYIDYINIGLGLFDNNSVEVLNLSYNYLKEDSSEYLANMLSHLKKLKTINLNSNDLKRGISSFLITLKNLYRQGKINLEILNLNKCFLDDIAFYELGELLKSKYCKLKILSLNENNIPSDINFFKKLKKNRVLTQIYFNKSNLCNKDIDDVLRVISNTNMEYLYIHRNNLSNFEQSLRIIYRTRLIKDVEKKELELLRVDSLFKNLDLSNNQSYNKNKEKVSLLIKGINESTLYCLDFSQILFGLFPEKMNRTNSNGDYYEFVNSFKTTLEKEQKNYIKINDMIKRNEIDKKKNQKNLNNQENLDFNKYEQEEIFQKIKDNILETINNEKVKFPIFLKAQARKIISKYNINNILTKKEEKKEIEQLIKYITYKRAEINIENLIKNKNKKKMILI